MLGPIGSEIMRLFRLLSPDEIDKYIVRDNVKEVQSSQQMAANGESMQFNSEDAKAHNNKSFPKDDQAKIIPFNEEAKKELESRTGPNAQEYNDSRENVQNPTKPEINTRVHKVSHQEGDSSGLESIGVLSAKQIKELEAQRLKKENENKDSATVFLLKERHKMRQSKKRLIEQQALKQYQTNAAQEFHDEVFDEETGELANADLKGILLNKKHY